jgi:hypothetical protein
VGYAEVIVIHVRGRSEKRPASQVLDLAAIYFNALNE